MSGHPIIDSHIHLFPKAHLKTLAWTGDFTADHPLNQQLSVSEYRQATESASNSLKGFVFIETDRISKAVPTQKDFTGVPPEWKHPLDEISFLARIIAGEPVEGEGHEVKDSELVLGIIPWAPITAGADLVSRYHRLACERFHSSKDVSKLKGYRMLFQDKPPGTMLKPQVTESLQWLGDHDLCFELGVNARTGGLYQLQEACQLLSRLPPTSFDHSPVRIIINHLCKPNLRLSALEAQSGHHPDFLEWKSHITALSRYPQAYMKLSGAWSELPPQSHDLNHPPTDLDVLIRQIKPWTDIVFETFGPKRIMFGSDWPVCIVGGPGKERSWTRWREFVEALLEDQGLSEEDKSWIWSKTAEVAYKL